jgi:hypothetical protein
MVVRALLVQGVERRKTFIGGSTKQLLMSSGQCRHGRNSCSKGQLETNTLPRRTGCALARHKASPQPAEVVASFPVSAKYPKPQTTGLMRRVGTRMMPCKKGFYSNVRLVSNNPVPYHPWRYLSNQLAFRSFHRLLSHCAKVMIIPQRGNSPAMIPDSAAKCCLVHAVIKLRQSP